MNDIQVHLHVPIFMRMHRKKKYQLRRKLSKGRGYPSWRVTTRIAKDKEQWTCQLSNSHTEQQITAQRTALVIRKGESCISSASLTFWTNEHNAQWKPYPALKSDNSAVAWRSSTNHAGSCASISSWVSQTVTLIVAAAAVTFLVREHRL